MTWEMCQKDVCVSETPTGWQDTWGFRLTGKGLRCGLSDTPALGAQRGTDFNPAFRPHPLEGSSLRRQAVGGSAGVAGGSTPE